MLRFSFQKQLTTYASYIHGLLTHPLPPPSPVCNCPYLLKRIRLIAASSFQISLFPENFVHVSFKNLYEDTVTRTIAIQQTGNSPNFDNLYSTTRGLVHRLQ